MTDKTSSFAVRRLSDVLLAKRGKTASLKAGGTMVVDPAGGTESSDSSNNKNADAMLYSQEASRYLQEHQLDESLKAYQKAADCYGLEESVIASVNAAGCYRNMGAVSRLLGNYNEAVSFLRRAEDLYSLAKERIRQLVSEDGNRENSSEALCLDLMILETIQSRATFHFQQQNDVVSAVNCHEDCIELLLELNNSKNEQEGALVNGVFFSRLPQDKQTELIIVSIRNLGGMYCKTAEVASEDGLRNFEEALQILRIRLDGQSDRDAVAQPLTQALRYLSEIYFQRDQMDRAVDALHDAMDIELSVSEEPSTEALEAMDKMGLANEQMRNLDKALTCYEKALLARSRYYGEDHICVAKSLVNVARIMELQDNNDGALDLYKAAHKIYAQRITSTDFQCASEDAAAILQLIPSLLDQDRFEEAMSYLNKCLEVADEEEASKQSSSLDKSQIYYNLGRASIGLHDYVSATICLMEAAKTGGAVTAAEAVSLLQSVEHMQHGSSRDGIRASRSWDADDMNPRDVVVRSASSSNLTAQRVSGDGIFLSFRPGPALVTPSAESTSVVKTASFLRLPSSGSSGDSSEGDPVWDQHDDHRKVAYDFTLSHEGQSGEFSSVHPDSLDEPSVTIDVLPAETDAFQDSGGKQMPLLCPLDTVYSDAIPDPEPASSDSNQGITSFRGVRGLLRGTSSPRKSRDDRSLGSQQRSSIAFFGDALRRRKKQQGFQSLPEEQSKVVPTSTIEETVTDEDSSSDAPLLILSVEGSPSMDDISEITMRFENPTASRDAGQEWWWGVTAEGFGRWFPASYVNQAVQVADAFLSAKAIHSKSNSKPAAGRALETASDDDESVLVEDSGEQLDFASDGGINSPKNGSDSPGKDWYGDEADAPGLGGGVTSQHLLLSEGKDLNSEIEELKKRLAIQQKDLGNEHEDVATSLFTLAVFYSRDGDVDAAIKYATDALKVQRANENVKDAARSLHFLADLYLHQKEYKQALEHYAKAMNHETNHFGYYCDATAKTLNCIGTAKLMQNDFREAMESHEEALRILKECHGEDLKHPLVSETLCHIGSVYYRERNSHGAMSSTNDDYTTFIEGGMLEVIGRAHEDRGSYRMAIAFFEEKLQVLESKPITQANMEETATTLNGLGMLSSRAGLFVEAIDYYEKALNIQLELGCDEVHLATARVLTGAVQYQLGHWHKALALLEEALYCLKDELGERHETVAATHFQIGTVQTALCNYDVAMSAFNEAWSIQQELLGDEHPATLRTRRGIGNVYAVYESELTSAFEHFDFVLDAQKRIHGERHPNVAETIHSIGRGHAMKGDFTEALKLLEECYYMRVEFLGWDHPLQATTLHDIAKIHLKRGRLKKTLHICDVVLTIRRDSLSERHIDVAGALLTKGSCLVALGNTEEAAQRLLDALGIAEEAVGPTHPLVADIHVEIGGMYLRKCQFDSARESIQKALDIYEVSNLDDDFVGIRDAKEKMEQAERDELLCV